MSWMRALRFVALGLSLAYVLPLACGSGGVVGGTCRTGFTACDGQCVDLQSNYEHCGSCSRECSGRLACVRGRCGGEEGTIMRPQGGAANAGAGAPGEAGNGAASAQGGSGELPDGGIFDSPVDGLMDAEAPLECLPPHDSPSHCGNCDTKCKLPTPLCAPDGLGSFACVPQCQPPLVECQAQCMSIESYQSDPDNCGKCGNQCPSGICQESKCVGARYGNVALLCLDFGSATANSSPTTLLGNAVFMPTKNPVKVLAYTQGASSAAVSRVHQVIALSGQPRGRSADIAEAKTVADVTTRLNVNDYQVLLIHDLDQAKSGEPAAAATTWESASVLSSFAKAGGVIIVLDGGDGTGEMHSLINAGNLLDPTGKVSLIGQTDITGEQVWNNAPFDVLGVNVLAPFFGSSRTCSFDTTAKPSSDTIFVLTDDQAGGAPVAIHRVIAP